MTIHNKYYYMRLNEWHHLYLGLIIVLCAFIFNLDAIFHIFGWLIAIDDLISHHLQGRYLQHFKDKDYYVSGEVVKVLDHFDGLSASFPLPQFAIHKLLYDYIKIHRFKLVRKITDFLNIMFGSK